MSSSSFLVAPDLSTTFGTVLLGVSVFVQPAIADDRLRDAYQKASSAASSFTFHGMGSGPTSGSSSSSRSPDSTSSANSSRTGGGRTSHFNSQRTFTPGPIPQVQLKSSEELNADLARTANSEGVNLFDSGYLNEARSKFLHALELNPGDQVAQANLAHSEAELAFKEHDYTRAVRRIRDAIDLGRDKLRERLLHFQHELERVEAQRRAEEERRQEIARKDAALFEVLSTPVATVRTPQVGAIANTPLFSATPILGTSLLS